MAVPIAGITLLVTKATVLVRAAPISVKSEVRAAPIPAKSGITNGANAATRFKIKLIVPSTPINSETYFKKPFSSNSFWALSTSPKNPLRSLGSDPDPSLSVPLLSACLSSWSLSF